VAATAAGKNRGGFRKGPIGTKWPVSVAPATGIPPGLFPGDAALFGRLRKSHVRTVNTEHATPVDRTFEPAKRAVNRLVVSNFNSYGHE